MHLLHGDLQPDVPLFPWQKLSLGCLSLLFECIRMQGLNGTFALAQRDLRVYESVFLGLCHGSVDSVDRAVALQKIGTKLEFVCAEWRARRK